MRLRIRDMGVDYLKDGRVIHRLLVDATRGEGPVRPGPDYGGRMTPDGPRVDGISRAREAINAYLAKAWVRFEADCTASEFEQWFEGARDDDGRLKTRPRRGPLNPLRL